MSSLHLTTTLLGIGLAFGSLLNQQPQYPNTVVASAL